MSALNLLLSIWGFPFLLFSFTSPYSVTFWNNYYVAYRSFPSSRQIWVYSYSPLIFYLRFDTGHSWFVLWKDSKMSFQLQCLAGSWTFRVMVDRIGDGHSQKKTQILFIRNSHIFTMYICLQTAITQTNLSAYQCFLTKNDRQLLIMRVLKSLVRQ